jgi:S1-C subfamily serine protease
MKMKTILTVSAAAALVLGIGATGQAVEAQQQDSQWSAAIGNAVTNVVLAEVQQEVANAAAQIAATTSVAVGQKIDARIQARLARVQEKLEAAQERAAIEAWQQAEPARPRVYISGDGDETGWLGVTPEDISADRAKELKLSTARGIYISEVEEGSPAEKAGLKSGDVITEFNGQHVEGVTQFRRLVRETPPGHNVAIVVSRDGRTQTINATLSTMSDQFQRQFRVNVGNGMRDFTLNMPDMHNWEGPMVAPRPATPLAPTMPLPPGSYSYSFPEGGYGFGFGSGSGIVMGSTPSIGISGENLSGQLGTYFGAPDGEGVLIREVQSGSPAEKGGLKAGDVITKVAGERVRSISDLQYKLREKRDDKPVQITVLRRGSETNVTVEPSRPKTIAPARGRGVA